MAHPPCGLGKKKKTKNKKDDRRSWPLLPSLGIKLAIWLMIQLMIRA
jgi:hypothetical protein